MKGARERGIKIRALIEQGRIIETGTPEELKARHACRNLEEVFIKLTPLKAMG